MFGSSLPPVVYRRTDVLFTLFVFVCRIEVSNIVLCFCILFVFVLCFVCPVLPVSLDCANLTAPSVLFNVYLLYISVILMETVF